MIITPKIENKELQPDAADDEELLEDELDEEFEDEPLPLL